MYLYMCACVRVYLYIHFITTKYFFMFYIMVLLYSSPHHSIIFNHKCMRTVFVNSHFFICTKTTIKTACKKWLSFCIVSFDRVQGSEFCSSRTKDNKMTTSSTVPNFQWP